MIKRLYLEHKLGKQELRELKIRAIAEDSSLVDIVTKALQKYLTLPIDKHASHDVHSHHDVKGQRNEASTD